MTSHSSTSRGRLAALAIGALITMAACGSSEAESGLSGFVRDPAPQVDAVALPDLSQGGEDFALRAAPGELLVVYFGFTNCPDICPTTLADLRTATRKLDPADAERISLAMVTVDPDRDIPVLVDYAQTFMPDAHALATTDAALLQQAADPFGVTYSVEVDDEGSVEVAHSSQLYVVDDQGQLVLTWQFGIESDEISADLAALLKERTT